MSEKELMYIEDILGHMSELDKICSSLLDLSDNIDVNDIINDTLDKNKKLFKKIYNMLGE